jgi:hypothetical protein
MKVLELRHAGEGNRPPVPFFFEGQAEDDNAWSDVAPDTKHGTSWRRKPAGHKREDAERRSIRAPVFVHLTKHPGDPPDRAFRASRRTNAPSLITAVKLKDLRFPIFSHLER